MALEASQNLVTQLEARLAQLEARLAAQPGEGRAQARGGRSRLLAAAAAAVEGDDAVGLAGAGSSDDQGTSLLDVLDVLESRERSRNFFTTRDLRDFINPAIALRQRGSPTASQDPSAASAQGSLQAIEATRWVANALTSSPAPHPTTFPFRSHDMGVKQLLALQRDIAAGNYVRLEEFAHAGPGTKDALAQRRALSQVCAVVLDRDGAGAGTGPVTTADFVALLGRYMEAMLVVHPEQFAPMARYVFFVSCCAREFGVRQALEADATIRQQVAATGVGIADPHLLNSAWFRLQSVAPRALGSSSAAVAARPAKRGRFDKLGAAASTGGGERGKGGASSAAVGVCFPFNSTGGCQRERCKYAHKCRKCGADGHAEPACGKTA